jgi:membrane associated rhomboid family serine protease
VGHGGLAHADAVRFIGDMIVPWTFGISVEGKVGALQFLSIYFAPGLAHGVLQQLIMLGATEGSTLGACAVIFGLMGIAMIWAPKHHVEVFHQALFSSVGQHITSMSLHLSGAAHGVPLGVYLLRSSRVDSEGWDWFSVRGRAV